MKLHLCAALLAFAAPQAVHAEPSLPDTAGVTAALDAHPAVQAARARVAAARSEARALDRGPHEITVTAGYLKRSVDREGRFDEYDAQLSRAFRLPGKARLDREAGVFGVTAAENRAEDARHQAALLLAGGWWDWLAAAAEARIDRQAVTNAEKLLDAVRQRVAQRDAAVLEADQTEAMLGTARIAAAQSSGRERVARVRLETQFPLLPLPEEAPDVSRPELPGGGLEAFGEMILTRSHEIAAAEAEAGKLAAQARRAGQDRLADPALGLRVFSERNGAERGAGVLFSLPLGGGHRSALADRASAEADAARSEAMAARLAVRETAAADIEEARFRYAAWQRAREGLNAQVAALVKLREGHAAGEIDLAQVLLGERQVHDAFRTEAQSRADAMRALTRLRIDSHSLWIGD